MSRQRVGVIAALFACLIGCSLWVDPYDVKPRCERGDAGEVCPMGTRCVEGRCEVSCDTVELCGDNVDNDCDGKTDEMTDDGDVCGDGRDNDCDGTVDEGSDIDGDTFTWCGDTRSMGGGKIDCDPYNSAIYPGAPEICDGRDNDCDTRVDEAPASGSLCKAGEVCRGTCVIPNCVTDPEQACADGERCDPITKRCVAARQACGEQVCGDDAHCDAQTMDCVEGLLENGSPCSADSDCHSQSCIDARALRLANASDGARVCGQACCSDAQCGVGQRCFASGTGARSCLPIAMVPMDMPRQCTTDAACAASEICALNRSQSLNAPTFVTHSELITSTCRTPQAGLESLGQRCVYYGGCASRICTPRPGTMGQLCSTPCGSTSDCREFEATARQAGVSERAYCRYVTVNLDSTLRVPDYASVCVIDRRGETGPGKINQPCSKPSDCTDGGCVGVTATRPGRCSPTCCSDDQCGRGEDGRQIHCRPFPFGSTYEMRCDLGLDP